MITPSGLHILLTYTCNYECDHCFVWGGPGQEGVFTLEQIAEVLQQARSVDTIEEIFFEGGEPFLYFPILVEAVATASARGFRTGIVSNGYWATEVADARAWLVPLRMAGLNQIDVSCDSYHGSDEGMAAENAQAAARDVGLMTGTIALKEPGMPRSPAEAVPGVSLAGGSIMYRGRAVTLTENLPLQSWQTMNVCPFENLLDPKRVHLDPLGNIHACQGVVIGNIFERGLKEILEEYDPLSDPILSHLIEGGPAELARHYNLEHEEGYVDACHLCYTSRKKLRQQYPSILAPDQMYGAGK